MIHLRGCPLEKIPAAIGYLIESAKQYRSGLPLVAGGQMDQPQAYLEACRFIWSEMNRYENEDKLF